MPMPAQKQSSDVIAGCAVFIGLVMILLGGKYATSAASAGSRKTMTLGAIARQGGSSLEDAYLEVDGYAAAKYRIDKFVLDERAASHTMMPLVDADWTPSEPVKVFVDMSKSEAQKKLGQSSATLVPLTVIGTVDRRGVTPGYEVDAFTKQGIRIAPDDVRIVEGETPLSTGAKGGALVLGGVVVIAGALMYFFRFRRRMGSA